MFVWLCLATAAPTLALIDAGVEPRNPLALHPAVGAKEQAEITLTLKAEMVNEGMGLPIQTLPPLQMSIATEVLESGPERIRYALTVVEAKTQDSQRSNDITAAMNEAMAPMTSIRGVADVDPFGRSIHTTWEVPSDVEPGLKDELVRAVEMLFPLRPTAALGIGARWTITEDNDDHGFAITDTQTWTLSTLSDSGWVLDAQLTQTAETQTRGGDVLEKHLGAGQAQVMGDPSHLLPKTVKIGLTTRSRMTLEGGIQSVTSTGLEATVQRSQ